MKKLFFALAVFTFPFLVQAQEKEIDSTAIFILDKMSDVIGDLASVSFTLNSSVDKLNADSNIEKHYKHSKVTMVGPDKFVSRTQGDQGNHAFWYNGKFMTYYSFDENNYVTLEAPDNIITMIDSMHTRFDFKFPAADFFYPAFTDDIMEAFDNIQYKGQKIVDGESCFYIIATNPDTNVQIWVSNTMNMLPKRLVIIQKNKENMQYEAHFTKWELNPEVPNSIFEFTPPPGAKLISILEK
ncbi:DUF2092 domain-containing protein [Bizionia echini]|uniref:DUF2092 domain-containing protein n=1 Tax=Bizionia echini TaxID=649333 RepID=UPI0030DB2EB5|tara:strand:+ start:208 stop:930 length:723 start_codon:yes stop_codon:yes gene_type:complete